MYHYRANNVYSLDQSKRKDGIGREAKEEVVFLLAASKPGDFSVFPVQNWVICVLKTGSCARGMWLLSP